MLDEQNTRHLMNTNKIIKSLICKLENGLKCQEICENIPSIIHIERSKVIIVCVTCKHSEKMWNM